jgi:hypothetical protein
MYDRPLWKPGRHRIPELIVQLGEIGQGEGTQQTESTKVLAALGSGDGPLSVRVRPSSLMGWQTTGPEPTRSYSA